MNNENLQNRSVREVKGLLTLLLLPLGILMHLWGRTWRFRFANEQIQKDLENQENPAVILLWHNRLFLAAEIYRRYRNKREVYGMVSASKDGAWLSAFFRMMGIGAVRGSRHYRGTQALRGLLDKIKEGHDVAVTPDGSRGPCYDMKPGALLVARTAKSPILLLSPNPKNSWRLKSWDRFYLPKPFSTVELECEWLTSLENAEIPKDKVEGAAKLKEKLDQLTKDPED
jgi:lysophospholipid acyltransferase (LPLAT)-like uncharacterized protein